MTKNEKNLLRAIRARTDIFSLQITIIFWTARRLCLIAFALIIAIILSFNRHKAILVNILQTGAGLGAPAHQSGQFGMPDFHLRMIRRGQRQILLGCPITSAVTGKIPKI